MPHFLGEKEEAGFAEFRRKIRAAEVLSAAMEHLLSQMQFNGKVSVVIQNGRVLKSGYEYGTIRSRFNSTGTQILRALRRTLAAAARLRPSVLWILRAGNGRFGAQFTLSK